MLAQAIGLSNQVTCLRQLSEKPFPSIKCLANLMDCVWEGFPPGLYSCNQLAKTWNFKGHGREGGRRMDIYICVVTHIQWPAINKKRILGR